MPESGRLNHLYAALRSLSINKYSSAFVGCSLLKSLLHGTTYREVNTSITIGAGISQWLHCNFRWILVNRSEFFGYSKKITFEAHIILKQRKYISRMCRYFYKWRLQYFYIRSSVVCRVIPSCNIYSRSIESSYQQIVCVCVFWHLRCWPKIFWKRKSEMECKRLRAHNRFTPHYEHPWLDCVNKIFKIKIKNICETSKYH